MLYIYIYLLYRERERKRDICFSLDLRSLHLSPSLAVPHLRLLRISLDDAVSFAKLTMARKRKKIAAQDDSAVPRRWGSSQVAGGDHPLENHGESWDFMGVYSIIKQTCYSRVNKPLFFYINQWEFGTSMEKKIYEISRLNGGSWKVEKFCWWISHCDT